MIGIVLISFVSASLVDFLSTPISGTVEVKGPIFYLDKFDSSRDSDDYYLRLNSYDTYGESFTADGQFFFSDSLGIDNEFYDQDFIINFEAQAQDLGNFTTTSIHVYVLVVDEDEREKTTLCDTIFTGVSDRDEYPIFCEIDGAGMSQMEPSDKLKLIVSDGGPAGESYTKIYIGDKSYLQVVAQ